MNPNIPINENIYKNAMETYCHPVIILNSDYIVFFANKAATNLFGTLKPLIEGMKCPDLLGESFFTEELKPRIKQSITEKRTISMEKSLKISGHTRTLSMDLTPVDSACQLIFRDNTENRQREKDLAIKEQKYRAIYETAPLAFQSLNDEGYIIDVNPAWLKIMGYERNEVTGKWFGDFLHPDWVEKFKTGFPKFKKTGSVHDARFRMKNKNGSFLFVSFEGCISRDHTGNFKQTYCTFKDITEQYSAESIKRDFLTNMSHELRTPLNGIMGMLSILMQEEVLPHQQQYLELAWKSSENLYAKVKDILNVTSLTNKEYNIKKEQFELISYIKHLVELSRKSAEEKGLLLEFTSSVEECHLKEDRRCLSQIVLHLINNGIKFSSSGTVSVHIKHEEKICIVIKDEGIGIPENRMEEVFDPFRQLEDPYTKTYSGMGIGLAIVKAMADMIHADIVLNSQENRGSEFTITLFSEDTFCLDKEEDDTEYNEAVVPLEGIKTILIAEDEAINRIYLKQILTNGRRTILEAKDGVEAVEQYRENKPDLILMDIGLPNKNGLEAIKEIRQTDTEVPIIAVTAYAEEKNRKSMLKAGANSIILKPYNKKEVLARISAG